MEEKKGKNQSEAGSEGGKARQLLQGLWASAWHGGKMSMEQMTESDNTTE